MSERHERAVERCRRCRRPVMRARRYRVTDTLMMLVCAHCDAFVRYEARGGEGT